MVAVPNVVSGQEITATWGNQVATAVNQLRDNYSGQVTPTGLEIERASTSPASRTVNLGATVAVDWEVTAGTQDQYRVLRSTGVTAFDPPSTPEYWNGNGWQAAEVWIDSTDTDAQLTGWSSAAVWGIQVTARDSTQAQSNTLTWALQVSGPVSTTRTSITVAPATRALANDVITADLTITHTGGPEPGQAWIRRTDPASLVRYWDGTAWQTTEQWFDITLVSSAVTVTLIGFAVGSSTLDVRARVDSTTVEANWSAEVEAVVTRADAQSGQSPAIVRTGDGSLTAGSQTLAWTYSDPDSHAAESIELRRVPHGPTAPTYWNGTGWQAAQTSVDSATPSITITVQNDFQYEVVVIDTNGDRSNRITWSGPVTPPVLTNPGTSTPAAGEQSLLLRVDTTNTEQLLSNEFRLARYLRSTPDTKTYWDGTAWQTADTTTVTGEGLPSTGTETNYAITITIEQDYNYEVTAWWRSVYADPSSRNLSSPSNTLTWTAPDSAPSTPVIVRIGGDKTVSTSTESETFAWTYSGAQTQKDIRVIRQVGSDPNLSYWNGTGWQATSVWVAHTAHSVTTDPGDWAPFSGSVNTVGIRVRDTDDDESNEISYTLHGTQ